MSDKSRKRQRRDDSPGRPSKRAHLNGDSKESKHSRKNAPDQVGSDLVAPKQAKPKSLEKDQRNRSRSRDREGHTHKRSRSREGHKKDDKKQKHRQRSRSRSPRREAHEDGRSRRSPPRAIKSERPREESKYADEKRKKDKHNQPPGRVKRDPSPDLKKSSRNVVQSKETGDSFEAEDAQLRKMMGFSGFKSTKETKVPGNDMLYGVRTEKTTQYRHYMNRVGGFNRPLSPG